MAVVIAMITALTKYSRLGQVIVHDLGLDYAYDTNTMLHVLAVVPTSILTGPKVKYPGIN